MAYEINLLPGRKAQHSAWVTFSAYRPLHRPIGSVFSQHEPRTSATVTSSASVAVVVVIVVDVLATEDAVPPAISTQQSAICRLIYIFIQLW